MLHTAIHSAGWAALRMHGLWSSCLLQPSAMLLQSAYGRQGPTPSTQPPEPETRKVALASSRVPHRQVNSTGTLAAGPSAEASGLVEHRVVPAACPQDG